ncbi:hypothetical protein [Citricoccus nitrophenolicus]|uniref:hypothetical protein n=1 Tax=Citricoccus nitrophenolicus TaxID=863575 RepID=UPI0039B5A199
MSIDPRVALEALVSAFEEHLAAASGKRDDDDPAVESAFFRVADSFEAYEDALYAATGEFTPLDVYDDDDEDDGDEDDGDGDSDSDRDDDGEDGLEPRG